MHKKLIHLTAAILSIFILAIASKAGSETTEDSGKAAPFEFTNQQQLEINLIPGQQQIIDDGLEYLPASITNLRMNTAFFNTIQTP